MFDPTNVDDHTCSEDVMAIRHVSGIPTSIHST